MPKDLFVSFMRTFVPLTAGWIMSTAGVLGMKPDSTTSAAAAGALLTAAYYAVFRILEQLALKLQWDPLRTFTGVLLGWARPPEYPKQDSAAAALRGARVVPPPRV